jgi:mannosidase alpha-like ER degradation enhancer 1
MVANKAGVPAHKTHRRRPELHLHFLPDYVDPMLQLQLATMDVPSDEFITTGSTASFGGDPSAPLADGEEPLLFGHGEGVPVVRDVTNPLGCQPYPYTFQDETVVVHRGDCTFLEKLDHATAAGASGVVVINNDDRGVHPSATDEEVAAVGGHIEDAVLVVVSREAGSSLQHMLDSAERLDGRVWLIVDPEGSEAELGPEATPTRTKDKATAHVQTLYINGHAVANTRLVW